MIINNSQYIIALSFVMLRACVNGLHYVSPLELMATIWFRNYSPSIAEPANYSSRIQQHWT